MDDIFVTQPFTARHVRYAKKLGFGSLAMGMINDNRLRDNDSDVGLHADSRYKNGIDRSRNV